MPAPDQMEEYGRGRVRPTKAEETPELRSIRERLDEAAAKARSVQRACSGDDPHLGLATTEELIEEIHARMSVSRTIGQPMRLDYRTIDGDAPRVSMSLINVAGPNERLTMEATIESGELPDAVRLESDSAHIWLYPDGKTVRIETEAKS